MAPVRLPTAEEVAAAKRQRQQLPSVFQPSVLSRPTAATGTAPAPPSLPASAVRETPTSARAHPLPNSAAPPTPPQSFPAAIAAAPSTASSAAAMTASSASGSAHQAAAAANPNAVIVSSRQRGNPVLKAIKAVPWIYGPTTADYLIPEAACALFLSLRYHLLHPNYLLSRLRELRESAPLRLILLLVDSEAPEKPILQASLAAAGTPAWLSELRQGLSRGVARFWERRPLDPPFKTMTSLARRPFAIDPIPKPFPSPGALAPQIRVGSTH